ncbi:MAG: hypothetical protein ACRCXZ_04970 [Patescibacteria group bacterium]
MKLFAKIQLFMYLTPIVAILIVCYGIYSGTVKSVQDLQNQIGSTVNGGKEFVQSLAPVKEAEVSVNVTDIKNELRLKTRIQAAEFSSKSTINVAQSGARDTWIIGGFLEGSATFSYSALFSGIVVYNLDKDTDGEGLDVQLVDNVLTIKLPTPIVTITEVNIKRMDVAGNLANIHVEESQALSALESNVSVNYFYKQFFTGDQMKQLFTKSNLEAKTSLESFVGTLLNKAGAKNITVNVIPNPNPATYLTAGKSKIEFNDVLTANPVALENYFKSKNPKAKIIVNTANSQN